MQIRANIRNVSLGLCFVLLMFFSTESSLFGQDNMKPQYASAESKEIVEKMVAAHGDLKKWRNSASISFDNIFFNPMASQMQWPSPWWVSQEVIDPRSRRAYHDWPLNNAQLAFDGNKVWTVNWNLGNMPKMQAMFFFYFTQLPWLTQDSNVNLGVPGKAKLPGMEKEFITVSMEFTKKPTVGKTDKDSFKLYIDPDTYLLKAYEYIMGFGAMLDAMGMPDGQLMGPMLRIHDKMATIDGFTVPIEMHTMAPDGSQTFGYHVINNYSFKKKFDESRMSIPQNAIVDNSSAERMSKK